MTATSVLKAWPGCPCCRSAGVRQPRPLGRGPPGDGLGVRVPPGADHHRDRGGVPCGSSVEVVADAQMTTVGDVGHLVDVVIRSATLSPDWWRSAGAALSGCGSGSNVCCPRTTRRAGPRLRCTTAGSTCGCQGSVAPVVSKGARRGDVTDPRQGAWPVFGPGGGGLRVAALGGQGLGPGPRAAAARSR